MLNTFHDDFEHVLTSIMSYISILMFILPMYSFIIRLQNEKQTGIRRHFTLIGISNTTYTLALFISYNVQMFFICFNILLVIKIGGLFQKSLK